MTVKGLSKNGPIGFHRRKCEGHCQKATQPCSSSLPQIENNLFPRECIPYNNYKHCSQQQYCIGYLCLWCVFTAILTQAVASCWAPHHTGSHCWVPAPPCTSALGQGLAFGPAGPELGSADWGGAGTLFTKLYSLYSALSVQNCNRKCPASEMTTAQLGKEICILRHLKNKTKPFLKQTPTWRIWLLF